MLRHERRGCRPQSTAHWLVTMAKESGVTVGLAGDLIPKDGRAKQPVAKAGGKPLFVGSQAPCQATDLTCGICAGLLSLAVQVITKASSPGCL